MAARALSRRMTAACGEPGARMKVAVGQESHARRRSRPRPRRGLAQRQAEAASPIVPLTQITSPGPAPRPRRTIRPAGTSPSAVTESVSAPFARTVSPPSSGQPKSRAASPSPCAKSASQASVQSSGSASARRKPTGSAPFRGEVRHVDAERLAGDRSRSVLGQEMDALDERVER